MINGNDLFLLMFSLSQSKEINTIKKQFIEAINSLSDNFSWSYGDNPQGEIYFKIASGADSFGFLNLDKDSGKPDNLTLTNISNATALLAILLQNAVRSKLLEQQNTELLSEINDKNIFLQNLINTVPSGLYLYHIDKNWFEILNPRFKEITGYTSKAADDESLIYLEKIIHPDDIKKLVEKHDILLKQKDDSIRISTFRINTESSGLKWIRTHDIPFKRDKDGKLLTILGIADDITDEIMFTNQLEASLKEKQVLIREIHHRVKNNLQIVSSLLNLQASSIRDTPYATFFDECRSRVMSMAHVHEQLYRYDNLYNINFDKYMFDFVKDIHNSFDSDLFHVKIDIDCTNVMLPIDQAIPLGLIINEFLLNSYKHAFTDIKDSLISISITQVADQYTLIYKDNGKGYEDKDNTRPVPGLGLDLVNSLILQIRATFEHINHSGTQYKIIFSRHTR
ncbi:MAG TPA: histidine kinase dimerization/phosphoacceptor domain -containing protein [Spirochaetota bacterium]|nr:histidine kinase dimerization/phosphoacceptor domain -containing protein [Spirochaetota bacterium]